MNGGTDAGSLGIDPPGMEWVILTATGEWNVAMEGKTSPITREL